MTAHSDSFAGIYAQFSGQVRKATPEQKRRASLAVCAAATDRADAENLLGLLGLLDREEQ